MIFLTHLAFGLLFSINFGYGGYAALALLLGSLLPDIDTRKSLIGRLGLSRDYFGHRGFFHSLVFSAIVYVICFVVRRDLANPMVLGMISHLAIDSLNPKGVRWFWPSQIKLKGPLRVGGVFDFTLLVGFLALSLAALIR